MTRTVLITGGNGGLGFACSAALLSSREGEPWHVVLASRDPGRTQAAAERLNASAGPGRADAMTLDLASLTSVAKFSRELHGRLVSGVLPPLHGLVCNAGVQSGVTVTTTADGFESDFGINHLGHFALVASVLPDLARPARIAVVSSGVHDPDQKGGLPAPAWNDPAALARGELGVASEKDSPFALGQRRYATSKLANVYFTYGLAARLPDGVTANAFDPGLVPGTGLMRDAPGPLRFVANHVMPRAIPLLRRALSPNVHTAADSGAALARLLNDPALEGTSGKYFEGRQEIRSSTESYDRARADDLWEISSLLTDGSRPHAR